MSTHERDKLYLPIFLFGLILLIVCLYWFAYAFWYGLGWTVEGFDDILIKLNASNFFSSVYKIKALLLLVVFINVVVKAGKPTKMSWYVIILTVVFGLLMFLWPAQHPFEWMDNVFGTNCVPFIFFTVVGYITLNRGIALLGRKIKSMGDPDNDQYETFEQCRDKIETDYSINIPMEYQYKKKKRKGWINVVNPFRATMVLGTPGSGKSFSVYKPFIEQAMHKGYTAFLYDYKFPDLTEEIYNEYLDAKSKFKEKMNGKVPQFCVVNFDDPRYSMRCNPINPRYITDPADTSEIADIIMRNVNPQSIEREDFFSMSAKVYIDALIWYLRIKDDGRYCTFPHLIELMGMPYEDIFTILLKYEEIRVKITPFVNALKGKAQEQLQGQIASAQIPLLRFASPALYWVLSGDDFTLDVNSKEDPKIVCIGNNPDRQTIYGTTLALYTSRTFKEINHKGKYPCMVLLDELPTIYIKGIDNLIATARSNKVAIVLGAQDESQLRRDYGDKESEVVFNTVGNIFAGQVNGKTAKALSETFGREYRQQESETTGGESNTINRSFHQIEILPQSRIETLTQGYFFGKVADDNATPIEKKLFCGKILIDLDKVKRKEANKKKIPPMQAKYFDDEGVKRRIENDKDSYLSRYLLEDIRKEQRQLKYANPNMSVIIEGSDSEKEELAERLAELKENKEKCTEYLNKIIKKEQDIEVNRVLEQNYKNIKLDVISILKSEGIEQDDLKVNTKKNQEPENENDHVFHLDDATSTNPYPGTESSEEKKSEKAKGSDDNNSDDSDNGGIDTSVNDPILNEF